MTRSRRSQLATTVLGLAEGDAISQQLTTVVAKITLRSRRAASRILHHACGYVGMLDGSRHSAVGYIRPDSRLRRLLKCWPLLIALAEVRKTDWKEEYNHDVTA